MVLAAAAREDGQAGKIGHSGEESDGDREKEMQGDGRRLGGQNDQFTRLCPHVRALNLLISNGWWMEWYTGQNEKTRWYGNITKLFSGIDI